MFNNIFLSTIFVGTLNFQVTVLQIYMARILDSFQLREQVFKVCAAMSNLEQIRCSSSLRCTNEHLAIDNDGYLCTDSN